MAESGVAAAPEIGGDGLPPAVKSVEGRRDLPSYELRWKGEDGFPCWRFSFEPDGDGALVGSNLPAGEVTLLRWASWEPGGPLRERKVRSFEIIASATTSFTYGEN